MPSFKKKRTEEMLREFLALQMLRLGVSGLEFVSISQVEMSPDLKYARVYWSLLNVNPLGTTEEQSRAAEQKAAISAKLVDAAFELKRRIAQELGLRFTPQLRFEYDTTLETATRLDNLLKQTAS